MTKIPSRLLNEPNTLFGLSVFDIAACGYTLIFSHQFLEYVHLELLSFVIATGAILTLMRIRQTNRPKIIRDFIGYKFSKGAGGTL